MSVNSLKRLISLDAKELVFLNVIDRKWTKTQVALDWSQLEHILLLLVRAGKAYESVFVGRTCYGLVNSKSNVEVR